MTASTKRPVTAIAGEDQGTSPFLRILFVARNHLPHVGGAEISTHHLARALVSRGHCIAILTTLRPRSAHGVQDALKRRLTGRPAMRTSNELGYQTFYSVDAINLIPSVVDRCNPDVVIAVATDPAFAMEALSRIVDRPAILYVRGAAAVPFVLAGAHFDAVVANSPFISRSIQNLGVPAEFLPSVFPPDIYRVPTTRSKVLFVNPIKKKGLSISMALASEYSEIPFVFSLGWRMNRADYRRVRRAACALGNVEVRSATNDPSALYRDARVVLVPTQWPEAWPRVVSEAQLSGIPAIGGRVGGIPDAMGAGGLLVDPAYSTRAWSEALSALWHDHVLYEDLSTRAREHIQRPEMNVENVVSRFERLVHGATSRHAGCAHSSVQP